MLEHQRAILPLQRARSDRCSGAANRLELLMTIEAGNVRKVRLGAGTLEVSEIGCGTLAWGETGMGFGSYYTETILSQAFKELVEGGVNLIDTSEVYGRASMREGSSSEQLIAKFRDQLPVDAPPVVLSSKFFPAPWSNTLVGGGVRLGRKAVVEAIRGSITRLGCGQIDLYQMQFPFPYLGGQQALLEGFAEAVDFGLCKSVGVCNFDVNEIQEAHAILAKHGVPLASNQVREMEISVLAYEPLAKGLLTGKFHEHQHQDGPQPTSMFSDSELLICRPIMNLLRLLGAFEGGRTTAQVALNYIISKGAIPIVGVKNVGQAREVMGAAGWNLSDNDLKVSQILDERLVEMDAEMQRQDVQSTFGDKRGSFLGCLEELRLGEILSN
ncbi:hypothetical protein GUITHDRAFT_106047 [Guillardia theta CCMP2712]|uniref:NADP-dependent oxidoreductase domain-containing protein n=1 Tax=Guillardia theta (strain CCMP2712) TaxID=905079 RepID=L1JIN9_GUITC|nr:hypothetical protein GUITHDRAFT_106047 [Guillardia theta CCMP2712]EKX47960.1 hypothetical protein GUITHDRAFT_106047 [Guillardia theta CCMP2712]|eukprot:XP_005834940.1 hypothetical protein GUITHDRAFT_106047 [Guillardia theta CCMP2712]